MKPILFLLVIIPLAITVAGSAWHFNKLHKATAGVSDSTTASIIVGASLTEKLNSKALLARQYALAHGLNTTFCFLVDMDIPSGKARFFVYNFEKNAVLMAGLVTHGRCNQNWLNGRKYGNSIGCGCTSLGKYKVGNAYQGKFGLAYKLAGLEQTNSNAYPRFVVLHSMQCVPESEVAPFPICQSDGCPTVSPAFLKQLAPMLNEAQHSVLLWIFD